MQWGPAKAPHHGTLHIPPRGDVLGGAAIGGLTATATGGAFWPAVGLGALCGATWYVWNEVKDTIRPVE